MPVLPVPDHPIFFNAHHRAEDEQSILPLKVEDDEGNLIEVTVCDSISGGADEVDGMPRRLTLTRYTASDGPCQILRAVYIFYGLTPIERRNR